MKHRARVFALLLAVGSTAGALAAACGGDDNNGANAAPDGGGVPDGSISPSDGATDAASDAGFNFPTPIHHIIVVVKENHTFDNFFGEYDGGGNVPHPKATLSDGGKITRPECPAAGFTRDFGHTHAAAVRAFNDGGFNGLDLNTNTVFEKNPKGPDDFQAWCTFSGTNQLETYWDIAKNFTIADNFFSSLLAPSFPGHMECAIGYTPAYGDTGCDGGDDLCTGDLTATGCLSPPGETVQTYNADTCEDTGLQYPCWDLATWMDLFPSQLSYGFYGGFIGTDDAGAPVIHTPVSAVRAHSTVAERIAHYHDDRTIVPQILEDTSLPGISPEMPNVMFWDDSDKNSEHPPSSPCCGEQNDATIVNAAMSGKHWNDTVVLITFDDWGGMYDHVQPAVERCANNQYFSPGFRVPLFIISPYAKKGFILHDVAEQASIPKLIEQLFNIPMTSDRDPHARDGKAGSLLNAFDFTQSPSAPVELPFTSSYCPTPLDCAAFVADQ